MVLKVLGPGDHARSWPKIENQALDLPPSDAALARKAGDEQLKRFRGQRHAVLTERFAHQPHDVARIVFIDRDRDRERGFFRGLSQRGGLLKQARLDQGERRQGFSRPSA